MAKKKKDSKLKETDETLKDMVSALNELPTDVLKQLLSNLDECEQYYKEHPEEFEEPKDKKIN